MPETQNNPYRDDQHARRRGGKENDLDGKEAASLHGGPDHSDDSTDTDSDNNDTPTDAPSE